MSNKVQQLQILAMKKNINHNHSTKRLIQEKSSSIVFFIFSGKFGVGERDETISLTYIALSSFKCIKIAVTKSYLHNCVTALKFV